MEMKPKLHLHKVLIGAAAMAVWFLLVWTNKTEVAPFVDMLKQVLMAVGVYHLALTSPKE